MWWEVDSGNSDTQCSEAACIDWQGKLGTIGVGRHQQTKMSKIRHLVHHSDSISIGPGLKPVFAVPETWVVLVICADHIPV